jgi:hypothetical protein
MRIHTHPFYEREEDLIRSPDNFSPPSPQDMRNSVQKAWSSRFTGENDGRATWHGIPQKYIYSREYVFDGKALWSSRANDELINVLVELTFDDATWIINILKKLHEYTIENYLLGKYTSYLEYIDEIMDQGISLEFNDKWKKRGSILVNEDLECAFERRDRHLVFPSALYYT